MRRSEAGRARIAAVTHFDESPVHRAAHSNRSAGVLRVLLRAAEAWRPGCGARELLSAPNKMGYWPVQHY